MARLERRKKLDRIVTWAKVASAYQAMFDIAFENKIDTWDIQWVFSCMLKDGLSIVPKYNLVSNIGTIGTHTQTRPSPFYDMKRTEMSSKPFIHPAVVAVDIAKDRLIHERVFGALNENEKLFSKAKTLGLAVRNRLICTLKTASARLLKNRYPNVLVRRGNRKSVLLSYLSSTVSQRENAKALDGHSNKWESREIAALFLERGFNVFAINWDDSSYEPERSHQVIFDLHTNLSRLADKLPRAKKLLHITGSNPEYSNRRELERVDALNRRRKSDYAPKRQAEVASFLRSLEMADACSLIGTERTLSTFPEKYHQKITLVSVSGGRLWRLKSQAEYVPPEREFLWFFGSGAVHKGLDLLLEVFAHRKDITLNVIGYVDNEKDFMDIYHKELKETPNIHYWGSRNPATKDFFQIARRCFCFIAPSCSESISTAAVTCMQLGLFPIASEDTGVLTNKGLGLRLKECSQEEIEASIDAAMMMSSKELEQRIHSSQSFALDSFSRRRFSEMMSSYFKMVL